MAALGITELIPAVRTPDVVGVSRNSLRYYPWRNTVIPNGVDFGRFSSVAGCKREECPTILFVGTYERRKRGRMLQIFSAHLCGPAFRTHAFGRSTRTHRRGGT